MRIKNALFLLFAVSVIVASATELAFCNGGKGKKTSYESRVYLKGGELQFVIEMEKPLFLLNSVKNKYKVVRIRVLNHSNTTIDLSAKGDSIEFVFEKRSVSGILDLSSYDPALWDSFSGYLRDTLAYPEKITGVEENIFVFIPDMEVEDLPKSIKYKIQNLPSSTKEVILSVPVVRK